MEGQGNPFYSAMGEYDSHRRTKNVEISDREDRVSHFQGNLEAVKKENEGFAGKGDMLKLESDKMKAEFGRDMKKKERLEDIRSELVGDFDSRSFDEGQKNELMQSLQDNRHRKVDALEDSFRKAEKTFDSFTGFREHQEVTSSYVALREILDLRMDELVKREDAFRTNTAASRNNWKSFVELCVEIAKKREELERKIKQLRSLSRRCGHRNATIQMTSSRNMSNESIRQCGSLPKEDYKKPSTLKVLTSVSCNKDNQTGAGFFERKRMRDGVQNSKPSSSPSSVSYLTQRLDKLRTSGPTTSREDAPKMMKGSKTGMMKENQEKETRRLHSHRPLPRLCLGDFMPKPKKSAQDAMSGPGGIKELTNPTPHLQSSGRLTSADCASKTKNGVENVVQRENKDKAKSGPSETLSRTPEARPKEIKTVEELPPFKTPLPKPREPEPATTLFEPYPGFSSDFFGRLNLPVPTGAEAESFMQSDSFSLFGSQMSGTQESVFEVGTPMNWEINDTGSEIQIVGQREKSAFLDFFNNGPSSSDKKDDGSFF